MTPYAIRIEMHKYIDGQLNVTRHFCAASVDDLAAGRLPVTVYPCAPLPGVTKNMVLDLIRSRLKKEDHPSIKCIGVDEVEVKAPWLAKILDLSRPSNSDRLVTPA